MAKTLPTLLHLRTAAIERRTVLVYIGGELLGNGQIDAIDEAVTFGDVTEDIVTIRGERYVRGACTFIEEEYE